MLGSSKHMNAPELFALAILLLGVGELVLWRMSKQWGEFIQGLLTCGGRGRAVEAAQILTMGDSLAELVLARHNKKNRCIGKYNRRHRMRTSWSFMNRY